MAITLDAPRGLSGLRSPLAALVAAVLRGEGRRLGEVGIVLADDALLRRLNRDWRGIDRATDVISFAYDELEPDARIRPVAGDLLVSLDRVRDQARRYRVTPGAELARLVTHGTLHLCGHDHLRADERRRMRAREAAVLRGARACVRALNRRLVPPPAVLRRGTRRGGR
jgi:rRNA maturation RNase YbeY